MAVYDAINKAHDKLAQGRRYNHIAMFVQTTTGEPTLGILPGEVVGYLLDFLTVTDEVKITTISKAMHKHVDDRWFFLRQRLMIQFAMTKEAVLNWFQLLGATGSGHMDLRRHLRMETLRDSAESEWAMKGKNEEVWAKTRFITRKRKMYDDSMTLCDSVVDLKEINDAMRIQEKGRNARRLKKTMLKK